MARVWFLALELPQASGMAKIHTQKNPLMSLNLPFLLVFLDLSVFPISHIATQAALPSLLSPCHIPILPLYHWPPSLKYLFSLASGRHYLQVCFLLCRHLFSLSVSLGFLNFILSCLTLHHLFSQSLFLSWLHLTTVYKWLLNSYFLSRPFLIHISTC